MCVRARSHVCDTQGNKYLKTGKIQKKCYEFINLLHLLKRRKTDYLILPLHSYYGA